MMAEAATGETFRIDDVLTSLNDLGWAVVPNVISATQCDQFITEIHQWIDQFGEEFPQNIRSLIHQYNISHLEVAWKVRLLAKPVFAELWGTEKLLTSLDGIAIGQPPENECTNFENVAPGAGTLHIDQEPQRLGLHAYQGAVYLEEALEDDWTFMVIEKSHKFHQEFFKAHPKRGCKNWCYKLGKAEIKWFGRQGCEVKRLSIPKGSLVLWDSRTVHAGAPPIENRANPDRWRYVIFVSMTPAIWANEVDMKSKQEAFKKLRITRHWSSDGFSMFKPCRKNPMNITILPDVAKTKTARLLAGDIVYDFKDGAPNGKEGLSKPEWSKEPSWALDLKF